MVNITIEQRTTEPLMIGDKPWEDFSLAYLNVIKEGDTWRMWYESTDHTYKTDTDVHLSYATSKDGIHWEKPELGLREFQGSRKNNLLILGGKEEGGGHGQTVFIDDQAPASERYKMVLSRWVEGKAWVVFGGTSPDGLNWTVFKDPILPENSDTQTVCFREGKKYRMWVRMWAGGLFQGKRTVGYTESEDFTKFPNPVEILAPDDQDPADLHFYNCATTKLKDNLYIMFPSAFYKISDTVYPHVAVSRDGVRFERIGREPMITRGPKFDQYGIYVAPGAIPGPRPNTWWFYYIGSNLHHDQANPSNARYDGGYGRFLLSVNG